MANLDVTYNFDYINPEMREQTLFEASVQRRRRTNLSFSVYDGAYILPSRDLWVKGKCLGGVVDKDGTFIKSSAWHEGMCCDSYPIISSEAKQDNRSVVYMGFFTSTWGHAITDNLKKLWFLETEDCKELQKQGVDFVYITHGNAPLPNYAVRLFQLAGYDISSWKFIKEVTHFSRIIVPDNSFIMDDSEVPGHGERYYTEEYKKTLDRIKGNISPDCGHLYGKKLYFTRTAKKIWYELGEKSIEDAFRNEGYTIVSPEKCSVDNQIAMLMHCISFAATEGSISHNVIFCKPHTPVTVVRKVNDVNKYQMALNDVAGVDVTYIDAHRSIRAHKGGEWGGPFYLYVNGNLERFFKKKKLQIPLFMQPSWWLYMCLERAWYTRVLRIKERLTRNNI